MDEPHTGALLFWRGDSMNREDLENAGVISKAVEKQHRRIGRRITKSEAITAIRQGREEFLFKPGLTWPEHEKKLRRLTRSLSYQMVQMIKDDSQDDPIWTIFAFYYRMDDLLCNTENMITVNFTNYMKEGSMLILEMIEAWKGENIRACN